MISSGTSVAARSASWMADSRGLLRRASPRQLVRGRDPCVRRRIVVDRVSELLLKPGKHRYRRGRRERLEQIDERIIGQHYAARRKGSQEIRRSVFFKKLLAS